MEFKGNAIAQYHTNKKSGGKMEQYLEQTLVHTATSHAGSKRWLQRRDPHRKHTKNKFFSPLSISHDYTNTLYLVDENEHRCRSCLISIFSSWNDCVNRLLKDIKM